MEADCQDLYSGKLILKLFHVDCLSGYSIVLCGTFTQMRKWKRFN